MPPDFDFTKLSPDGLELEQLTRDLCQALGYRAGWSGKGPDSGRDLIVREPTTSDFGGFPRKWLVSCKHKASSGRSANYADVGDVPGRLAEHGCQGFLLVTTTQPSSSLMDAFERWEANTPYLYYYWDSPALKRLLLREAAQPVAQVYFPDRVAAAPRSDQQAKLSVVSDYSIAEGMVHYVELSDGRSFYFQSRKEPVDPEHHLAQFSVGFEHLASRLPGFMTNAVRGIWYDDKHSSYLWRVDLAYDSGFSPNIRILSDRLSEVLVEPGDLGGQFHDFEFRSVPRTKMEPQTPRTPYESKLQLFGSWPDESIE
jgi:hypothetical protein